MQLTKKQEEGLKIALERFHNHERYTVISGYAGTGKSTLVRFIIDELPILEEEVVYAAYTGKATQVLQKKGNKNTSTLHRLLYESYPKPDGSFVRKEISFLPYRLVVIDECSMVPRSMVETLAKHTESHFIFLGDPEQLPPIDKNDTNGLLDAPHIFLDEIMRQEAESEIIRLSMDIRQGKPLSVMRGSDVQVIEKEELHTGMLTWADQILAATNETRINVNTQMRELLGRGDSPEDGDKVICLRNYWETYSDDLDSVLINGTIGTIHNVFSDFLIIPHYVANTDKNIRVETLCADFISDTQDNFGQLTMDKQLILTGKSAIDRQLAYKVNRYSRRKNTTPIYLPLEFTYGYAITGHKAQGSEWDKVLVIEERFPFSKEEHRRWLYTCVTRAASKLILVKN